MSSWNKCLICMTFVSGDVFGILPLNVHMMQESVEVLLDCKPDKLRLHSIYCTNTATVLSSTNKLTTQIIVLTVYKIQINRKQKWNMFCLVYWLFFALLSVSNVFVQCHPDLKKSIKNKGNYYYDRFVFVF